MGRCGGEYRGTGPTCRGGESPGSCAPRGEARTRGPGSRGLAIESERGPSWHLLRRSAERGHQRASTREDRGRMRGVARGDGIYPPRGPRSRGSLPRNENWDVHAASDNSPTPGARARWSIWHRHDRPSARGLAGRGRLGPHPLDPDLDLDLDPVLQGAYPAGWNPNARVCT